MKNSIKPTVGRNVLCHTVSNRKGRDDVLPGIIVRVFDGLDCINVAVLGDPANTGFDRTTLYRVPICDPDTTPPEMGDYCTWMPYQVGQAAKTEALQKKMDAAGITDEDIAETMPPKPEDA